MSGDRRACESEDAVAYLHFLSVPRRTVVSLFRRHRESLGPLSYMGALLNIPPKYEKYIKNIYVPAPSLQLHKMD